MTRCKLQLEGIFRDWIELMQAVSICGRFRVHNAIVNFISLTFQTGKKIQN